MSVLLFFFFKQKTAYEMRISDWSSDVCSSDLRPAHRAGSHAPPDLHARARSAAATAPERSRPVAVAVGARWRPARSAPPVAVRRRPPPRASTPPPAPARAVRLAGICPGERRHGAAARKSVVYGKRVSVRVDLGGRRLHKTQQTK